MRLSLMRRTSQLYMQPVGVVLTGECSSDEYTDADLDSSKTGFGLAAGYTESERRRLVPRKSPDHSPDLLAPLARKIEFGDLLDNLHVRHDFQQQGVGASL